MNSITRRSLLRHGASLTTALGLGELCAGCSSSGSKAGRGATLSFWSMWSGAEEQNFLRVLKAYEDHCPGVTIENLGAVREDTKTVRAIVAGVPPDLFTLADSLFLGPMAANGALEPLDELFHSSGLNVEDFVPASLGQCRFRGRLYAMPYLIDNVALLWNKRHFREAGLNPERPPSTLEELQEFAIRLTTRRPDGSLTQLGFCPVNNRSFDAGNIYFIFLLFGGWLYNEVDHRVSTDSPSNITALEWYADLIRRLGGYRQVNSFASGFGQAQGGTNPFFMGKISMMLNGEWNPYWASQYAPDLEYGVAPVPPPASRPQSARSTWYGGNMICIPKGAANRRQAWDMLVWMQTDEAQILFAEAMNNLPNRRSALKSRRLRDGAPYRAKFSKFLDLAESPNGGYFPAIPVANLYQTELINALEYTLAGDKTAARALADVRARVQSEMERYR